MSAFRTQQGRRNKTQEDGDLVMAGIEQEQPDVIMENGRVDGTPELPESVANSLLFELPREIRDRIYSFCLTSRDSLPVEWPRAAQLRIVNPYCLQPQLLRTCKIIRDEASPLLYTLNNLTFHHSSDANVFVRALASPTSGRQISHLSLSIKTDMRLWMPYITSNDYVRSLRFDFPNLKELGIRFRSAKWNQRESPENNLKTWSDDSRLDEVVDGLRHVFYPAEPETEPPENEHLMPPPPGFDRDAIWGERVKAHFAQIYDARLERARREPPIIRVCCACRVHPTHFTALTTAPDPAHAQTETNDAAPIVPVREGEAFRGFTPVDLQNGVKKLFDAELGSANVSRTPYTLRKGILLALEIHCIDPRKDPNERETD